MGDALSTVLGIVLLITFLGLYGEEVRGKLINRYNKWT